jgi:predicted nuclease of restriction endonuclease-like (RecB) superfamily
MGSKTNRKKTGISRLPVTQAADISTELLRDIKRLIEKTRSTIAATVNTGLTILYWRVGKRIRQEILKGHRADYGKAILATLSQELSREYGRGFSYSALTRMVRFAQAFPDEQIVVTLSQQLSWSHIVEILPLENPLQREFYAAMCRLERWSVRTLRRKIDSMLYERTAISKKPEDLVKKELTALQDQERISPDLVFRDPYVLDFLNLKDIYDERDPETAILRELENFLLELGTGFSFVARQKRMVIDEVDHYLDLLLFHRKLRRLVALELKLGKFKAAYKGQMELYLRWLEKYEKEEGEENPIGLILCAEGARETIELLQLDKSGIRVAQYLTELPPKNVLEKKLRAAVQIAQAQLEQHEIDNDSNTKH